MNVCALSVCAKAVEACGGTEERSGGAVLNKGLEGDDADVP
jgi:hypothetical protein